MLSLSSSTTYNDGKALKTNNFKQEVSFKKKTDCPHKGGKFQRDFMNNHYKLRPFDFVRSFSKVVVKQFPFTSLINAHILSIDEL